MFHMLFKHLQPIENTRFTLIKDKQYFMALIEQLKQ